MAVVLSLFVLPSSSLVAAQNEWESPLKQCWNFELENPSRIPPASDNDVIFLTSSKGSVIAINQQDGSLEWEADLGGNIWTNILTSNGRLFISAYFGTSHDGGKAVFREVDSDSGVPLWQLNEEIGAPLYPLIGKNGDATLISKTGVLLRVGFDGKLLWKKDFGVRIITNPEERDGKLVFGTAEKSIMVVESVSGSILQQLNTGGVPTRIALGRAGAIFVANESGRINAFNGSALFPFWTAKTGAATSDIELFQNDLIVSSNDNFVYRISASSGNKIWKRKLAGRILGSARIDSDHAVYLTTGSTTAVILSLTDGKLVNKIDLGASFVSGPVKIKGGFAAPTESAILAVTNHTCSK